MTKTAALVAMLVPMAVSAQTATTVQQDFDAAQQRTSAKDWAGALSAWETLEQRTARNPRSLALVRLRKAPVLLALGRRDDAAASAQAGLAAIPTNDASLALDRYDGHTVLARIANASLDYATAFQHYRAARPLAATPLDKLVAWWGAVETGTFVNAADALAIDAEFAELTKDVPIADSLRGQIMTTRAQLYLNLDRDVEARKAAREAVKALGGLTARTNVDDVAARSMAGLAALQLGDRDDARRYLAMTGAGRAGEGQFSPPVQMRSPDCGGDGDLRPDDVAVIEFSVGDDGSVIDSRPVWSNRQGDAALAFARAARAWSWTPDQLKGLPAFFRSRVRVEMRCSTAFARPSLANYAGDALNAWLDGKGIASTSIGNDQPQAASALRAKLAVLEAGGKGRSLEAVPALFALAAHPAAGREESHAWAMRITAILDDANAPPLARFAADRMVFATEESDGDFSNRYRASLAGALVDPRYATDPETRATIGLLLADFTRDRSVREQRPYLDRVADDPALPANHPLKVGALIRIASMDFREGKVDAAKAAFERSGLSAEQCALLDATPQMRRSGASSADFPREAMYWGMEGWTRIQYDIAADGRTRNARTVLAYPPFVFSDAGASVVDGARFDASFRPGNTLGCGGTMTGVNFQLPS